MSNVVTFWIGLLGAFLFIFASFLGIFQFEEYNILSQYISETYATGTPYGEILRFFGYIPSGILLTIFALLAITKFPQSRLTTRGFVGVALFYGIATIVTGIFPCDLGCNLQSVDPSISQTIHTLSGLLTYIFFPVSILGIGVGLKQVADAFWLSKVSIVCGLVCIFLTSWFLFNVPSEYVGLMQRIIEGIFLIWIIICAVYIKNNGRLK